MLIVFAKAPRDHVEDDYWAGLLAGRSGIDANFAITDLNAEQVGEIVGSGVGGIQVREDQQAIYLSKGPSRCSSFIQTLTPLVIIM